MMDFSMSVTPASPASCAGGRHAKSTGGREGKNRNGRENRLRGGRFRRTARRKGLAFRGEYSLRSDSEDAAERPQNAIGDNRGRYGVCRIAARHRTSGEAAIGEMPVHRRGERILAVGAVFHHAADDHARHGPAGGQRPAGHAEGDEMDKQRNDAKHGLPRPAAPPGCFWL
jgi:hypothetical protein